MRGNIINPFVLPERGVRCSRPLCPWEVTEHESYFVDVDSTEESYEQFCKFVDQIDMKSAGYASLATGPDGCGKTALLHRCTHYLMKKIKEDQKLDSIIVDLSEDEQPSLAVKEKVPTAWTLIRDRIDLIDGLLTDAQSRKLHERAGEPINGLSYLTQVLLTKNKCLFIIIPPLELPDELKVYITLRRRGAFLFFESSHPAVRQYCSRNHGPATQSPVSLMTLDVLKAEDGWKFVSARLQDADGRLPKIEEKAIREFMETRIQNAGRTTIRELHVACTEVVSYAMENGAQTINLDDFAHYYLRAGGL